MSKSIIKEFKKDNITYYHLKCEKCGNIQETYHKNYINRKDKGAIEKLKKKFK